MKKIFFYLSIVLVIAIIFEIMVRGMLPRPGELQLDPQNIEGLLRRHPQRSYAYQPGFNGRITTDDYDIEVVINIDGMRDKQVEPSQTVKILAIGDSFTVGYGVENEEAWPHQLELLINRDTAGGYKRVLNGGVSGYSVRQARMVYEEYDSIYFPKMVILGLYTTRYWRLNDPYTFYHGYAIQSSKVDQLFKTSKGIIYSPYSNKKKRDLDLWLKRYFYVGGHLSHRLAGVSMGEKEKSDIANVPIRPQNFDKTFTTLVQLYDEIIKLNEKLLDRNQELIILLIEDQNKDGSYGESGKKYNDQVVKFCKETGIRVINTIPEFEKLAEGKPIFRLGNDHHWSKEAHKVVASIIMDSLIESSANNHWMETQVLPAR